MRPLLLCLLPAVVAASLSGQVRGQFIAGGNPADTLRIDNAQVRVVIDTELPFETEAPREHPRNRILVYLDSAHFTLTNADGRVEDVVVKAGDVVYSRAGLPYIIENLSGHPLRIVEIELKTGPDGSGPVPATKLDPVQVDPSHYELESENPQVRILRVHYGPHEKGALHEHQLNRVVIYLNDQGQYKEGDVRMGGPETHTEENTADTPADRIAVEIK